MSNVLTPTMLSKALKVPTSTAYGYITRTKQALQKPHNAILLVQEFLDYHKMTWIEEVEPVGRPYKTQKERQIEEEKNRRIDSKIIQLIAETKEKISTTISLRVGRQYTIRYKLGTKVVTAMAIFDGFTETKLSATFIRPNEDVFERETITEVGIADDGSLIDVDSNLWGKKETIKITLPCKRFTVPVVSIVEIW